MGKAGMSKPNGTALVRVTKDLLRSLLGLPLEASIEAVFRDSLDEKQQSFTLRISGVDVPPTAEGAEIRYYDLNDIPGCA
jgi:hypothetical protein